MWQGAIFEDFGASGYLDLGVCALGFGGNMSYGV